MGKNKNLLDDIISSCKNQLIEKTSQYKKVKIEFSEPKIFEDINYTYYRLPRISQEEIKDEHN